MKKLNLNAHNRLVCQAEEAKDLGLDDLSEGIMSSISDSEKQDNSEYTFDQLKKDVYIGLWKIASDVIFYHDVTQVDAEKVDKTLSTLSEKVIKDIEASLKVLGKVGALEPKLPGESK